MNKDKYTHNARVWNLRYVQTETEEGLLNSDTTVELPAQGKGT